MKERPILLSYHMVNATLEDRKSHTRRIVKMHSDCHNDPDLHPTESGDDLFWPELPEEGVIGVKGQYGEPGDRLWVKETYYCDHCFAGDYKLTSKTTPPKSKEQCESEWKDHCYYRAEGPLGASVSSHIPEAEGEAPWKPSIFMPRWASRIDLEITGLRIERLQDITEEDARKEGFPAGPLPDYPPIQWYRDLWNLLNLDPKPILRKNAETGKKEIIRYQSFPWNADDFEFEYPGIMAAGIYRGKPITVTPNPWVWVIEFKRITPP